MNSEHSGSAGTAGSSRHGWACLGWAREPPGPLALLLPDTCDRGGEEREETQGSSQVAHSLPGVTYKKQVVRAVVEEVPRDLGAEGWWMVREKESG